MGIEGLKELQDDLANKVEIAISNDDSELVNALADVARDMSKQVGISAGAASKSMTDVIRAMHENAAKDMGNRFLYGNYNEEVLLDENGLNISKHVEGLVNCRCDERSAERDCKSGSFTFKKGISREGG